MIPDYDPIAGNATDIADPTKDPRMWRLFRFFWCGVALVLVLAVQTAAALSPPAEERRKFTAKILESTKELTTSARPDTAKARKSCIEANDIARRYDPNDYWAALVEDCLAAVNDFTKNNLAACEHYEAATGYYAKVRENPRARNVEADIERILAAKTKLGCQVSAILQILPKASEPLSPKDLSNIVTRVANARALLKPRKDAAGARAACEEARLNAERFAPNEFAAGVVEECFAEVELFEKNQPLACTRYTLAETHYNSAKPDETGAKQAANDARRLNQIRAKLHCGP